MDNNLSYCLKCKSKKEMLNGSIKTNKRGMRYIQGECKDCGCKMNSFLKKDAVLTPVGK
jgi:hypothetical protein